MNTNTKTTAAEIVANTGAAGAVAATETTNAPTVTRTAYNWTALDSAVVVQLGYPAPIVNGERVTLEEEAAQELENVWSSPCGAAGGFGGFIYSGETWVFFRANRAAIRAALQEMAESFGDGGAVELVRGFSTFRNDKPGADDVGAILWGELPEECDRDTDPFNVSNACVWFALEETAHKWNDGETVEDDDDGEEEGGEE